MSDRQRDCAKMLFRVMIAGFVVFGFCLMQAYNSRPRDITTITINKKTLPHFHKRKTKYILQWTPKTVSPFKFMGEGNSAFVKNKCRYANCFVTDDRTYLPDLTWFDAVVFNGRNVMNMVESEIPSKRSKHQKYIFGNMESSDNFPVCSSTFDSFFNWTWTYKLNSDLRWGYFTIYDSNGQNAVGPATDIKWPEQMDPINEDLRTRLSHKKKAGAWFVSHCNTKSKREKLVEDVNVELAEHGMKVDVYGSCGELECSRTNWRACYKTIETDYYFYFSLENAFSEDYVTEKLLISLTNYAVPIVYGGADYSRFLPPGSYLDGRQLGAKELARTMREIMADKERYYDFFRWRNHYIYNESSSTRDICKLCEVMNNEEMVNTVSVWTNFREWWNGERYRDNCP